MKRTTVSPIRLLAFLAIALLSGQTVFAQKAAVKELQEKMKTFVKSDIIPSLSTWKSELDAAMSKEDLQKLNVLRAKAAELRKQGMKNGMGNGMGMGNGAMRPFGRGGKCEGKCEAKGGEMPPPPNEEMMQMRDEHQAIMEELKPLAQKYKPTLEAIGKKAEVKKDEWREKGKAIGKEWWAANEDKLTPQEKRFVGGMRHHFAAMAGLEPGMKKKVAAARFMLWDGKDFSEDMGNRFNQMPMGKEGGFGGNGRGGFGLEQNRPNPAHQSTDFTFTLQEAENVSLKVYDAQGNEVASLLNRTVEAGTHTIPFDTGKLASGKYFYKLITPSKTETKSLEVVK